MPAKQHLGMDIKQVTSEGTFEGLLATYNSVDLTGDMIEPGAFTKSLQENGNIIPLLWQHDTKQPIGSLTVTDTTEGLQVKGSLLIGTPVADYAYRTIQDTPVKGLSIGYDTVKSVWEGAVRKLKELRLWEGSIVTFPADTHALIRSVKHAKQTKDMFNAELAERQLYATGQQAMDALGDALNSLFWDGSLGDGDKVSMASASIQQFSDVYLKWLPEFLGFMRQEYGDIETMGRQIRERKEGRAISGANKQTLKSAHEQITSAAQMIYPLWQEEAGAVTFGDATTSASKSRDKSEPDPIHSAAKILELRSLIPRA